MTLRGRLRKALKSLSLIDTWNDRSGELPDDICDLLDEAMGLIAVTTDADSLSALKSADNLRILTMWITNTDNKGLGATAQQVANWRRVLDGAYERNRGEKREQSA